MLTIVLSGPKASTTQARNALAGAGLGVQSTDHDHGLPPLASGEEIREAQGFVTVHGDDVDRAHGVVQSLGWRLRLHYDTPVPVKPSLETMLLARLDALEAEVQALRAGKLPPIGGAAVESPPGFLQAGSYGAELTRRAIGSLLARGSSVGSITGGLVGASDCALSPPGSGMSVNVAPGEVWVPGSTSATQGGYYCRVSSSSNLSIAASDPTNPRIDTVVAQVQDAAYSGSNNTFQVAVVTGTPTAGATLTNLTGKGAVPASSLVIGYVLVPANAVSVTSGDLLNVATTAGLGLLPTAGVSNITATQSTSSATWTTLSTPDEVTGIVLPTNGLIAVWVEATWEESVASAASAALFVGSNVLTVGSSGSPQVQSAGIGFANRGELLTTYEGGLASGNGPSPGYSGDVTTGQVVYSGVTSKGGPCYIFAAAGTYTISLQFEVTSGNVSAWDRKLWVQAMAF